MPKALIAVFLLIVLLILQTGCSKTPTDQAMDARNVLYHGKVAAAKEILDKAAAADTTGAVERYGRGLMREYNGLGWEAMITYLDGAPLDGGFIPSIEGFMDMALKLNYLGNGLQMSKAMMDKFPDNPRGYLYAGRFFARYFMHDSVTTYFNLAKEKGIDSDELFLAQTEYSFVTGSNETLSNAMDALSKKSYSDGPTCSRIANLYHSIHYGDSAVVYARRACDDDKGNVVYGIQLAQYLFDERRIYEANALVNDLFKRTEKCSRLDLLGAYIATELGDVKRALELTARHIDDNRQSAVAAVQQGDYLAYSNNLGGAIIQYQLAYTLAGNLRAPDDFLTYLYVKLENAQLEYGDVTTAYAYYKEGLDRYPDLKDMDFFKAELVLRFPEVADSAAIIVDDNLSYNWSNGDWMQRAANYYRRSNKYQMSARCHKRLVELPQAKPEHAIYMMDAYDYLGEADSIVALADHFPLRVRRDLKVMARLRDAYLKRGDTAEAIQMAEQLHARTDEYLPDLNILARLYVAEGETEKAERLYSALSEKYPDANQPHCDLAQFQFEHGSPEKALAAIDNILNRDSLYFPAIELQGRMLERQGDLDGALVRYRKVIDLRGTIPYSYDRVARYLIDNPDSLLRAEGLARNAIVFYGNENNQGYITLGDVYMAAKKYKLARTQYIKALRIGPKTAELYFWLGRAQHRAGEKKDAQENLKKALELDPNGSFAASARALLK
ncbi:MAG: tetratricopeptide repeat protein [Candidatus Zixiibacteriota bacterium]